MFKGKKVMVFGAGISGVGAAEILAECGAVVTLYDAKERAVDQSVADKIASAGGAIIMNQPVQTVIDNVEIIVLSPGVSIYLPEIVRAVAMGKKVIGEVEVAYLLNQGKLIAITGTNGKTTTTTLVGEMVAKKDVPSAVGGNIGQALSIQAMSLQGADSILVAEISSFQLEAIESFRANISAILNITPDHLDRHKTFENYVQAKAEVLKNQTAEDYAILNYDDKNVARLAKQTLAKVCYFSSNQVLDEGVFVNEQGVINLQYRGEKVEFCAVKEMQLFGKHNVENALVAVACAYFAGVAVQDIVAVLKSFTGVEHRIEYVNTVGGVKYYNDSKATNPESSIKALEAFEVKVVLLAGGYDKNTDLTEFMSLVREKTAQVIFLGNAKDRFKEEAVKNGVHNIHMADSFEQAVASAASLALPGQVVLLSPACASYDMFNNFEERGRYFKELVNKL